MKILYLDSINLSFDFSLVSSPHSVNIIYSFETVSQAITFFQLQAHFELILYNPHIFIHLLEVDDFETDSFFSSMGLNCIPYTHPKDILHLSKKIEKSVINGLASHSYKKKTDIGSSYRNKCVLVTGAGGSIGSELVVQLLETGVGYCLCLDLSEFSIFNLKQKLSKLNFDNLKMVVGSIGDTHLLETIFKENNVDIIINASAYKHVSIMQDNSYAALNNNVLFFINLLRTASAFGIHEIVQVSTDKAADPSNVMGFSKLACEQILTHANEYLSSSFNYSIVRFGNVIGSSGSVVPIFLDNIKDRNKLRITDIQVERFMMQIGDAVTLILRAASFRNNEIYILDMGEPFKILDLAQNVLKNSVFGFDKNLIEFVGLESGEKLTEILFTADESNFMTQKEGMYVIGRRDDRFFSTSEMKLLFNGDLDFLHKKLLAIQE